MSVTWEAVAALTAIISLIQGIAIALLKQYIHAAIIENNDLLMRRINGTYVRSSEFAIHLDQRRTLDAAMDAKYTVLEKRVRDLEMRD
jgi:hypothetical protein